MADVAASDPIFSSYILASAADLTEFVWKKHVHSIYLPIAVIAVVHAVRISIVTRLVSGGKQSQLPLFQSMVLNMVVLFGGSTLVAVLLGIQLPVLVSPLAIAVYSTVHASLYLSGLGTMLVHLHTATQPFMDIILAMVDALCRTEAIASYGLVQMEQHSSPSVASSFFAKLVIGALISGGAPLIITAFQLNAPKWGFVTPPWVERPTMLLNKDLVGGMVVVTTLTWLTAPKASSWTAWIAPHHRVSDVFARFLSVHPTWRAAEKPLQHLRSVPYLSMREAKIVSIVAMYCVLAAPILVGSVLAWFKRASQKAVPRRGRAPKSKKEAVSIVEALEVEAAATGVEATPAPAPRRRGRPKKKQ
ncbi:hypothetical protein MVES1_003904 [Malassezia vespertilionis]|uniref:Uncharacterized protein n=1 Tax=Malassezia vespertilionis TaxID=2020962 RepID=A0A2N1J7I8_9BASI|nr:uncharacterized protein MVES1_003904 [Malassezia vespertilionis]PKI82523.1 hypothetical protein MVES_003458 [Malassezia vespertilionis]WFD08528.1 hypothetical protein MVES1_003904 [Malassezia vespertilionis]